MQSFFIKYSALYLSLQKRGALTIAITFGVVAPVMPSSDTDSTFVTTTGTGPDKWASVWLLRRHLGDSAAIVLDEPPQPGPQLVLFDTESAKYDRTGSSTTYSALLATFDIDDDVAKRLGDLVHEIEIDAWRTEVSLASRVLEQGFRGMQLAFGRDAVTQECYLRFFDRAAAAIDENVLESTSPQALRPEPGCLDVGEPGALPAAGGTAVETLPLATTLRRVGDGEKVVFVDTRERWEYDEGHIPGAINLRLRDVDERAAESLAKADLVIAYCVKDFRGYEVAKALRELDVPAAIMTPHGMRGWIAAGLPIAGGEHLNEADGVAAVRRLARTPSTVAGAR